MSIHKCTDINLNVFILDMNLFHLLDRIFDIFMNAKHKFSVYYIFLEFRTFFFEF